MGKGRGKQGAPKGNRNAQRHGVYALAAAKLGKRRLDRRTTDYQEINKQKERLCRARGFPSWKEAPEALRIVTQDMAFDGRMIEGLEALILSGENVAESTLDRLMKWKHSRRENLRLYLSGTLERIPRDVDLATGFAQIGREDN